MERPATRARFAVAIAVRRAMLQGDQSDLPNKSVNFRPTCRLMFLVIRISMYNQGLSNEKVSNFKDYMGCRLLMYLNLNHPVAAATVVGWRC